MWSLWVPSEPMIHSGGLSVFSPKKRDKSKPVVSKHSEAVHVNLLKTNKLRERQDATGAGINTETVIMRVLLTAALCLITDTCDILTALYLFIMSPFQNKKLELPDPFFVIVVFYSFFKVVKQQAAAVYIPSLFPLIPINFSFAFIEVDSKQSNMCSSAAEDLFCFCCYEICRYISKLTIQRQVWECGAPIMLSLLCNCLLVWESEMFWTFAWPSLNWTTFC